MLSRGPNSLSPSEIEKNIDMNDADEINKSPEDIDTVVEQSSVGLEVYNSFRRDTYLATEQFLKIMRAYQGASQDPDFKAFKLTGNHSWSEVLQKATEAQKIYLAAGQGVRGIGRSFTSKSNIASPIIRMIPNDKPLSILSGGLKLIIDAVSKIGQHREKVLGALLRIPDIIMRAENSCGTFPDQCLEERVEFLYVASLAAIEGIMAWMKKKPLAKVARALAVGPVYGKSFDEKMRSLNDAVKAVDDRIGMLRDASISKTARDVSDIHKISHAQDNRMEEIMNVLADHNKHAEWIRRYESDMRRVKKRLHRIELSAVPMDYDEFLNMLDVPGQYPECDLRWHLKRNRACDPQGVDLALSISKGSIYQTWQTKDNSAALFIEGRLPSLACRRPSPTSFLSSQLVQFQDDAAEAVVVYFFCGSHASLNDPCQGTDPLFGPRGMMRSLICQLLRLCSAQLSLNFIKPHLKSQLESPTGDLRALCLCFRKLVRQLPVTTVLFCVIDGICFLEKRELGEDCRKSIDELHDIVFEELDAVFKLLVTSPMRSRYVADIFPDNEHLFIHDYIPARQKATEREIAQATARRNVNEREFRMSLRPQMQDWEAEATDEAGIESMIDSDTENN